MKETLQPTTESLQGTVMQDQRTKSYSYPFEKLYGWFGMLVGHPGTCSSSGDITIKAHNGIHLWWSLSRRQDFYGCVLVRSNFGATGRWP